MSLTPRTVPFRLYLAGPEVFLPDPIAKGEALKEICRRHGAEGLFPMDNVLEGLDGPALAAAIREANLDLIGRCDAVIANMDPFRGPSMDVGTAYEMGVAAGFNLALSLFAASGRGKLVVGYGADRREYRERVAALVPLAAAADGHWRDPEGMSVEDFGLTDNLMMTCAAPIFETFEQAVAHALARLTAAAQAPAGAAVDPAEFGLVAAGQPG